MYVGRAFALSQDLLMLHEAWRVGQPKRFLVAASGFLNRAKCLVRMNRYRNISISSSSLDATVLTRYVENFTKTAPDRKSRIGKSRTYERICGEPSCSVAVTLWDYQHRANWMADASFIAQQHAYSKTSRAGYSA